MAALPQAGVNPSQNPIPDKLIAHVFDKEAPQIAFNVKTGEWIFTTPVQQRVSNEMIKSILKSSAKGCAAGLLVGAVAGPALGGTVTMWTIKRGLRLEL